MTINKDKWYIVSGPAGTYFGKVDKVDANGTTVTMSEARLCYNWRAASLADLAENGQQGVNQSKYSVRCKVTCTDVLRIYECSDKAADSLNSICEWKI